VTTGTRSAIQRTIRRNSGHVLLNGWQAARLRMEVNWTQVIFAAFGTSTTEDRLWLLAGGAYCG
jgi:hypothetical protein